MSTVASVRIRRLQVAIDVETYAADGTLLAYKVEPPVAMCESEFDVPMRTWLISKGVPPQMFGLATLQGPSPPSSAQSSSTAVGDTLLPHQYVMDREP